MKLDDNDFKDGYNTLSGFCKLRKAWKNGGPKEGSVLTEDYQVCFDSKELILSNILDSRTVSVITVIIFTLNSLRYIILYSLFALYIYRIEVTQFFLTDAFILFVFIMAVVFSD